MYFKTKYKITEITSLKGVMESKIKRATSSIAKGTMGKTRRFANIDAK